MLDNLIGLDAVRHQLDLIRLRIRNALEHGRPPPAMNRFLFIGPPGTGKTTVARLLGHLLYGLGVSSKPNVHETTGAELKGAYQGHTAPLVKALFARARDGVLFIDEAYGVGDPRDGNDTYAREAIATLVAELTSVENAGTTVVLAGYQAEMQDFLRSNAGLDRRFTSITFESFTPEECLEVARRLAASEGVGLTEDFERHFITATTRAAMNEHFGNAGWVATVLHGALDQRMLRHHRAGQPLPVGGELRSDDLRATLRTTGLLAGDQPATEEGT